MDNINYEIMRHFPAPENLREEYKPQEGLRAAWFVIAAARAAIDEIVSRTPDLTTTELFTTDAVAESLAIHATNLSDIIDK